MIRPLTAILLTGALLLGACGPSAEDKAEDRKAEAAKRTEAANRAAGQDLRDAAKTMQAERDAKKRMDPKIAVTALKAKGYTSGTSLLGPGDESKTFCIWATSPKTKRSYVYQSLTDEAEPSAEPVTWCVAAEYGAPVALTAAEVKRESLAGAEMGVKIKRDDEELRQNAQRLADIIEKEWTVTPNWSEPTNASEKSLGAKKRKMLDKAFMKFETTNGIQPGAFFGESHFCLVMYQTGGLHHAVVYQHLDKKVVRVKAGTKECTIGTVPRP